MPDNVADLQTEEPLGSKLRGNDIARLPKPKVPTGMKKPKGMRKINNLARGKGFKKETKTALRGRGRSLSS